MRAVIWTDIVEMTLSVTAVLLLLVGSMAVVGGPDAVFDSAIRTGRAKFFEYGFLSIYTCLSQSSIFVYESIHTPLKRTYVDVS